MATGQPLLEVLLEVLPLRLGGHMGFRELCALQHCRVRATNATIELHREKARPSSRHSRSCPAPAALYRSLSSLQQTFPAALLVSSCTRPALRPPPRAQSRCASRCCCWCAAAPLAGCISTVVEAPLSCPAAPGRLHHMHRRGRLRRHRRRSSPNPALASACLPALAAAGACRRQRAPRRGTP